MSSLVIKTENIGKHYQIKTAAATYRTLRESVCEIAGKPFRVLRSFNNRSEAENQRNTQIVWALRNINLEISRGEVVGIIGRNGAGKSTLLKILSRITAPSVGCFEIHGRIGSLLEVGTGFHPELTGRENIFLNGAILGMKRNEIITKFEQIASFAEVEKFLDTPVKYYSSGMYMRLAFSVASYLEPEVLLVDEVLAVGDASFQKKCLGRIEEIAGSGRTVIFVSHNTIAIQSLCQHAIWLDAGRVIQNGPATHVVKQYLSSFTTDLGCSEQVWEDTSTAPGNDAVRLRRTRAYRADGSSRNITTKTPFWIDVEYWNRAGSQIHITLHVYNQQDILAFTTGNGQSSRSTKEATQVGLFRCSCEVPGDFLNSGIYRVAVLVVQNSSSVIYRHEDALSFEILDLEPRGIGWYGPEPGVVSPRLNWRTEYLGSRTDIKQEHYSFVNYLS